MFPPLPSDANALQSSAARQIERLDTQGEKATKAAKHSLDEFVSNLFVASTNVSSAERFHKLNEKEDSFLQRIMRFVASFFAFFSFSKERKQNEVEEAFVKVFQENGEYQEIASKVVAFAKEAASEEFSTLRDFLIPHQGLISQIMEKGWHGLDLGRRDEKERAQFDAFRRSYVQHVATCVEAVIRKMGYSEVKLQDVGTRGWNSDIDLNISMPKGMKEEVATYACEMFYMIIDDILGRHSGAALDTECYVGNAADLLHAEQVMREGEYGEGFSLLEMTALNLQMLQQLGGADAEEWSAYKEQFLEMLPESIHERFKQSLATAEEYHETISHALETLINSGLKEQKAARLVLRRRIYQQLAPFLDKIKAEMAKSEKPEEKAKWQGLLNSLALIRTTFFDEGYLTKGACLKVVIRLGGQAYHNDTLKQFIDRRIAVYREPQKMVLAEQIAGLFVPTEFQSEEATAQENLSSLLENEAMYEGHFQQKLKGEDSDAAFRGAFIGTSKYALRVFSALQDLLLQHPLQGEGEEDYRALLTRAKELYQVAESCEKAKRERILNLAAAKQMLKEALKMNTERWEDARVHPISSEGEADQIVNHFLRLITSVKKEGKDLEKKKAAYLNLKKGEYDLVMSQLEAQSETMQLAGMCRIAMNKLKEQIAETMLEEFRRMFLKGEDLISFSALLAFLEDDKRAGKVKEKMDLFVGEYEELFASEKEVKEFFVPLIRKEALNEQKELQKIFDLLESEEFYDEALLPQERYVVIISKLADLGFVTEKKDVFLRGEGAAQSDLLPSIEEQEVEKIVLALCGFDKSEYGQVKRVLEDATKITLREVSYVVEGKQVDLTQQAGIKRYNEEMRRIALQAAAFTYKNEIIPTPAETLLTPKGEEYSLSSLLKSALEGRLSGWLDSQLTKTA